MKVLFICYANIGRSQVAEPCFKSMSKHDCESAGIAVNERLTAVKLASKKTQRQSKPEFIAHNCIQGIAIVQQFRPQVVLCDLGLPEVDGYEVARRLRQCSELSEIHLISTSGYGQEEDKQRALAAGFDAHLIKPIDFRELQRLLSELAG